MCKRIRSSGRLAFILFVALGSGSCVICIWEMLHLPATNAALAFSTQRKPIRGSFNVTESKLVHEVRPEYPALVQDMRSSNVTLNVTIDETGKVIDVDTYGGYAICNDAAQQAVKQWRYTPTLINNVDDVEPVRVKTAIKLTCGNPHGKLDPAIAQLIYRVRNGTAADKSEKNYVNKGVAMLEVTFTGSLQQGIERIKRIGFKVLEETGENKVIGNMLLERLNELRSLPDILLVAPHRH